MTETIKCADWLPHALPMRMLEDVVAHTDTTLRSKCTISAGNPFLQGNVFPVVTGVELLAQAAGVLFGLRKVGIHDSAGVLGQKGLDLATANGVVVQIKIFEVFRHFIPTGAELEISVEHIGGTDDVVMMEGVLDYGQQTILTVTLMIAMFQENT